MMAGEQLVAIIGALGAVVLVGRALVTRRVPGRHLVTLALIWAAIFASVALIARLLSLA